MSGSTLKRIPSRDRLPADGEENVFYLTLDTAELFLGRGEGEPLEPVIGEHAHAFFTQHSFRVAHQVRPTPDGAFTQPYFVGVRKENYKRLAKVVAHLQEGTAVVTVMRNGEPTEEVLGLEVSSAGGAGSHFAGLLLEDEDLLQLRVDAASSEARGLTCTLFFESVA